MKRATAEEGNPVDPLRTSGTADERALLQAAAVPVLSDGRGAAILQRLEQRVGQRPRGRWARRLAVTTVATLVAGSALAYGVAHLRQSAPPHEAPSPPRPMPHRGPGSPPAPPVAPDPEPREPARPARPPHRRAITPGRAALHPPTPDPPAAGDPDPVFEQPEADLPAPARLLIRRPGRTDAWLVLAGERAVGNAGSTPISLALGDRQITGSLGPHPVSLRVQGRDAQGTVGGRPIRFELADIPQGHALRAVTVGQRPLFADATLLESTPGRLWWRSTCDGGLLARAPGEYQGHCGADGAVSVTLPPAWLQLPALQRLIVLALLLIEREPPPNAR
jgi:hypothetical protein